MPVTPRAIARALSFLVAAPIALSAALPLSAQSADMSFFLTDDGLPGMADAESRLFLGDSFCHHLAYAAGLGDRKWRAYLDGPNPDGEGDVRARDRIGAGPWHNYRGTLIAQDLGELHSADSNLTRATALTVRGGPPPGHAPGIVPGTKLDGALFSIERPFFCFAAD